MSQTIDTPSGPVPPSIMLPTDPPQYVPAAAPRAWTTADGHTSPFPLFYDSCRKVYPSSAHMIAVYADNGGGPAECTGYPADRDRYSIRQITRAGGAAAAAYAQIIDYEPGLEAYDRPGAAREFADARHAAGDHFISYCSRVNLHRLHNELGACLWQSPLHLFWIPTLDGHQWTPQELAVSILRGWSVDIPSSKLWGNQFGQGGPRGSGALEWDESSLFGLWLP